jgi:hypothetical protein
MFTIAAFCSQDDKKTDYEPLSLIPAPASIEGAAGEFLLKPGTGIAIDPDFTSAGNVADLFNGFLENHYR